MKLLLKLLLPLCFFIVGTYAASPWWIPLILARQLPPGFQLEGFEVSYPTFSGIHIKTVGIKGEIPAAGLALAATDIRFSYKGWKTEIGSLSLDVLIKDIGGGSTDALTLADLSLPITRLTAIPPDLSVDELELVLHHGMNFKPGNIVAGEPLVLKFRAIKLLPQANNNFHLATSVNTAGSPDIVGQLEIDVSTTSRKAKIRFPATTSSPSWLTVSLEQMDQGLNTTTRLHAAFDADIVNQNWLAPLLTNGSDGRLTGLTGKLVIQAVFAGRKQQRIEHLTLATEQLQAVFETGTLNLDAEFLAKRDDEKIIVSLPVPAEIRYEDNVGKIHELFESMVPGLQRRSQPVAVVRAVLDASSGFVIQPGANPSMTFRGDVNLSVTTPESSLDLQATEVQIEFEDFSGADASTAMGLVTLNWIENEPFTYTDDDLDLKADSLSLTSTGNFLFSHRGTGFIQKSDFELHNAVIKLAAGEQSQPTTIKAEKISITAELNSGDGKLVSTGSGTFMGGYIAPMAASATQVDVSWRQLDLLTLAGQLGTKTQGFATEFDGETWTGFDFDVTFALLSNADINGSGTIAFDSGPDFPIEFAGNAQTEQWVLTLPATSIKLTQLNNLLHVAHFDLPTSVKLADGYIDLQGNVVVGDEITAKMTINGYELDASMLESSAHKADFTFNTSFGSTISASGPVSIQAISLAGGIVVQHIKAEVNLENEETFALKNLYAEVFDGQLNLESLRFSENRIEDTIAELSHINLGHLLAFADIDGLEGTGLLEISLPVGSDQSGVYVKNGTFNSTGPGYLAYTQEGVAGSNIGLQALENFQYQDLSGSLDYRSDGSYQIAIRLEGNNPDLYEGYPIVFKLNISGSLPELFEALFITGDFEESILKQIGIN